MKIPSHRRSCCWEINIFFMLATQQRQRDDFYHFIHSHIHLIVWLCKEYIKDNLVKHQATSEHILILLYYERRCVMQARSAIYHSFHLLSVLQFNDATICVVYSYKLLSSTPPPSHLLLFCCSYPQLQHNLRQKSFFYM